MDRPSILSTGLPFSSTSNARTSVPPLPWPSFMRRAFYPTGTSRSGNRRRFYTIPFCQNSRRPFRAWHREASGKTVALWRHVRLLGDNAFFMENRFDVEYRVFFSGLEVFRAYLTPAGKNDGFLVGPPCGPRGVFGRFFLVGLRRAQLYTRPICHYIRRPFRYSSPLCCA